MKAIKNLILDYGGVLIALARQRCVDHFKELGLADVENMLGLYGQQDFFCNYEKGLISSAEFRDTIRGRMGHPVSDVEIDEAWTSFLISIPDYKLELLLRLRHQYSLNLLSNTNDIHWQWSCVHAFPYKGYGVEDYFDHIWLSYKMNLAKPDAAIFRRVLDEGGFRAEETFFIDDSAENCRVAESLGISTYTPAPGEDWSHIIPVEH